MDELLQRSHLRVIAKRGPVSELLHDLRIALGRKQVRWNRMPRYHEEIGGKHVEFRRKLDATGRVSVGTARHQLSQNVCPFHAATLEA
jgi:hypothetical protein